MTINATTVLPAFLASLETLAIFFEAVALHTIASIQVLRGNRGNFPVSSIPASLASASLSASFAGSETFTVFCFTVAFDTATAEPAPWVYFIEEVVDFTFF